MLLEVASFNEKFYGKNGSFTEMALCEVPPFLAVTTAKCHLNLLLTMALNFQSAQIASKSGSLKTRPLQQIALRALAIRWSGLLLRVRGQQAFESCFQVKRNRIGATKSKSISRILVWNLISFSKYCGQYSTFFLALCCISVTIT